MKITELKPPLPRTKQSATRSYAFLYSGFLPLPKFPKHRWPRLDQVLTNRQSRRGFQKPLSFEQLSALMWHSARQRDGKFLEDGTLWQSRIAPSAGGCHPIHIVILGAPEFTRDILVYEAEHNGFGVVAAVDSQLLRNALKEVDACLRVGKGTVLWFLADIAKTARKYLHPESLIWRDSGTLLATISFVAEGLGIHACGLGIHESPSLRRLFKLPSSMIGVGGCIVSA